MKRDLKDGNKHLAEREKEKAMGEELYYKSPICSVAKVFLGEAQGKAAPIRP